MRCVLRKTPDVGLFPRALMGAASAALLAIVAAPLGWAPGAAASPNQTWIAPLTASGCNQQVCIYVTGSGTRVTWWSTTAVLPSSECSVAKYWANGVLVYDGNSKCGSAGTEVSSYWPDPGYFSAGTQLCNTWTGVPGKPCETVE